MHKKSDTEVKFNDIMSELNETLCSIEEIVAEEQIKRLKLDLFMAKVVCVIGWIGFISVLILTLYDIHR